MFSSPLFLRPQILIGLRKLGFFVLLMSGLAHAAHAEEIKDALQVKKLPEAAKPVVKATQDENAFHPATEADNKLMRTLDTRYQKAPSVTMSVHKVLKIGSLGQERKAKGTLTLSNGRLRLELEGEDKSLLIVNQKKFWAVTYPDPEFKEAHVQVITGSTASKKGLSQSILGLLTQGGFLKYFHVTGVLKESNGDLTYFLQPEKLATEFTRAQLKISPDGKEIHELHYWDDRDNETLLTFDSVHFGKKIKDSEFSFDPPAKADVMNM